MKFDVTKANIDCYNKYDRPSKIVQNWCNSKAAINALEIIATEITS